MISVDHGEDAMTVRELIAKLKSLPPDSPVTIESPGASGFDDIGDPYEYSASTVDSQGSTYSRLSEWNIQFPTTDIVVLPTNF